MLQLIVATIASSLAPPSEPQAEYRVTLADPAQRRVDVVARLSELDPDDRVLELHMPERYAFIQLPEPLLAGPLVARAGGVELEIEREAPYSWRVHTNGARELELSYGVSLTHRDVPAVKGRDTYEHPYVEADHALLVCGAIFIVPSIERLESRVRFGAPEGWPVLAPWPEVEPRVYAPPGRHALEDGLIALGRWQTSTVTASDAQVTIAFAPSEAEFAPVVGPYVERIVASELELFASRPFERFLFLFVPSDVRGFAGSAKGGSMVLSFQHGLPPEALKPNVGHLVAHEFFHTWASAHYDAPDELRFVNEGFTDYFAYLVPTRAGISSWEEFAKTLAEAVTKYESAAEATGLSLVAAGGPSFFASRDAYQHVYSGGLLVAALCDYALRARAEGPSNLDAFMRELNNDLRWSPRGAAPSLGDFVKLLAQRTSPDFARHLGELLQRTERFDFVSELTALGCKVDVARAPAKLELRANFEGLRITAIDPLCAAASIGLRMGDELIEVNGRAVTTQREARDAFAAPSGANVRVKLRRDGTELALDEPVPIETRCTIDVARWRT